MSKNYNQLLQSNNTDLQAILDAINELPEAGAGGSGDGDNTFPYTITVTNNMNFSHSIFYTASNTEVIVVFGGGVMPIDYIITGCKLLGSSYLMNHMGCYFHLCNFTDNATIHVKFDNPFE